MSAFQFIPKVFDRVEVRALCRPSSSTPISTNHFCIDFALCRGHCHAETGMGRPQTVATKLEAQNFLECHCTLYMNISPSLELRGLAQTMKNSPRPLFLFHQTLQLALYIGAGSILLAAAKPRFVRWTARWGSVNHHSRERVSTAPPHCAWGSYSCVRLLSHGNPFHEAPDEQFLCCCYFQR